MGQVQRAKRNKGRLGAEADDSLEIQKHAENLPEPEMLEVIKTVVDLVIEYLKQNDSGNELRERTMSVR